MSPTPTIAINIRITLEDYEIIKKAMDLGHTQRRILVEGANLLINTTKIR